MTSGMSMNLLASSAALLLWTANTAYAAEAPYGGTAAAIPGTVQAETYDTGGQGVAYSVSSTNGSGNSYRTDGIDLEATTDTGGGYDMGWTTGGQWFRYTVNVATSGTYTVSFRVAAESAVTDAFHLSNTAGTNLSGSVNVADTGGWQNWTTVTATVTLAAGPQTLTLNQDNPGWNINYVTFAATAEAPYGSTPTAIPGKVSASNYDTGGQSVGYNVTSTNGTGNGYRNDGIDLEATSDTGGGYDLGWTTGGQWFRYTVNVTMAGAYTVSFRVAAESAVTDAFHLSNAAGTNLSGSVSVPDTGGWQDWTTITAIVTLPAGQQTLTLNQDNAGWNINYATFSASPEAPFGGTAPAIPGTVQAENYDTGGQGVAYNVSSTNGSANSYRTDGIDLEATTDTSGGYDMGWTTSGQWFRYTVNVATAGAYTVSFRVAAESAVSDEFHLSNSGGTNLSGSVSVPDTGGWQDWTTVTATVTLAAGPQTLTLNQDNPGWNINYATFVAAGTGSTTRLVGYLANWNASYATYAQTLNFNKMTHLNLAFGVPPTCNGTCTSSSDMTFSLGQSNSAIVALVSAAHAAGVKVLVSIGGGGGDQQIIQFYEAGLSSQLIASLNSFVATNNLDGVDLDIESPNSMETEYEVFAADLISTFHPQNKLVTAAVAQYLQDSDNVSTATLESFDFLNVMTYSNLSDAQSDTSYFASLGVPKSNIVLGVPFFGQNSDDSIEESYSTILAAYPGAASENQVSGGSLDGGTTLYYVGDATMADETQLGVQYGGVMIWELSQDAAPPSSLLTVIQNNL